MFITINDKVSGKTLSVNTSRIITYIKDEPNLSIVYKLINNVLLEEEFTSIEDLNNRLSELSSSSSGGGNSGQTPSGGDTNIYRVTSLTEMNNIANPKEDDLCLVYNSSITPATVDSVFNTAIFPREVTVPNEVTDEYYQTGFTSSDYNTTIYIEVTRNEANINYYGDDFDEYITYESTDGLTYTRTDDLPDIYVFNTQLYLDVSSTDASLSFIPTFFINIDSSELIGIYKYLKGSWVVAPSGLTTSNQDVLPNYKSFTNLGIITGTQDPDIVKVNEYVTNINIQVPEIMTQFIRVSDYSGIQKLDVVKLLDTSNVTEMHGVFSGTYSVTELDLSSWDTSNVTKMSRLFYLPENHGGGSPLSNLLKLTLRGWNTSKVTDMSYMFHDLPKLSSLDLSMFDTSNVTNFSNMFSARNAIGTELVNLNISSFTIKSGLTNEAFINMFWNLKSLQTLDARNMEFHLLAGLPDGMFTGVPTNCTIIVKDDTEKQWFTTNVPELTGVVTVSEYESKQ